MANYIMRSNGTTYEEGKKKKKKTTASNNTSTGNNYIMRSDGTTYLEQPTVSSQSSGQLAPVKSKKVATTVAPTRANVSENTANKYSGYTREQLLKEKNKIQSRMNMLTGGDRNTDGKISLGEAITSIFTMPLQKRGYNNKKYKSLKKEYEQVNNALNEKIVSDSKITNVDKISEPFQYGVEKATEGLNTSTQKLRNIAPKFMKTDKQKITAKAPLLGDLYDKKVQENTKSKLGKVYHDLSFTVGNMTPAMIAPSSGLSLIATGTTSFGNSYQNALNQGKTDKQATKYGIANAGLEVGLQKVLGGISSVYGESLLGKTLKPKVTKVLNDVIKSPVVRNILAEAGGEFTEEYLQEILDPVVRNITLDENNKFKPFTQEALYNGILGALNSGMINSVSNVGTKHQINKIDKQISQLSNQFEKSNGEQQKTILNKIKELQSQKQVLSEQVYEKENIKESNLNIDDIDNAILEQEQHTKKQIIPTKKIDNQSVNQFVEQPVFNNITNQNVLAPVNEKIKQQKISSKVNEYIEKVKSDFNTDIDISTEDIKKTGIDYSKAKQTTIFGKIKEKLSLFKTNRFKNIESNQEIVVSSQDVNKDINNMLKDSSQKKYVNEHIAIYENIDKIIANAQKLSEASENKGRTLFDNWNYFVSSAYIDGNPYVVEFDTVYRSDTKDRHFRLKRLYPIEKSKGNGGDYPLGITSAFRNNDTTNFEKSQKVSSVNSMQQNEKNNLPKVKEGYTRLYRGLSQEYDPNYDRSKLDSPNGYDTLTDSYELARQYGKNVYYIDLPTSQISNSVIDENPNSETYGDRNLAYKNDKPAGLNGVKGNEYLLYTDHDNFNSNEYHKVGEDNSTKQDISLEQRVSGDELLDAQDLIEELKGVGAKVDDNGYVTVYHQTSNENAKNILETGKMTSKENGVFFSTSKDAQQSEGRGQSKLEFKIPAEKLVLDDLFSDNADVKIPLNQGQELEVSDYIINSDKIDNNDEIKNTIEPLRNEISQLQKDIKDIKESVVKENNTIAEEKNNDEQVLTIRPDRKQYSINKRVQKAIENSSYKGIKEATAEADKYIKFTTQERRTFKDALSKYAGMTKEDFTNVNNYREIEAIVENFANREYNYVDTELKSMKNQVRNTKIKITDDLKNRITDYNDFRKSNFGKLKLGNEGQYIDDVWAELSGTHPEYFSENITNEEDMLYALSDFMNEDINLTEQFRLSDEDIETVRDRVFNTLAHNQLRENDINELQTELDKVVERKKRTVVQENLLHEMGITKEDIQKGKDIAAPAYQRTDPVRLHEKVFGYETGKKINDATVYQVKHNEAERTRFLNKERDEIKALGIKPRSKESAAVQKYAEKEYINEKGEYSKYGDKELAKEFTSVLKQNKIKKAAAVLRAKYDTYIDSVNEVLVDMGYDPIPKRDNYMKHFYELTDKFSQWGVPFNRNDMRAEDLPTDINGITDEFKPGKSWFASAMERKGMSTVYDAITGIDTYIDGASNLIYHTEDIQRYRTLSKFIREEYGQQHGLDNIENMSEEEIEERLSDIQDHKLSKYVAWLDEQANALAGKKGKIDRAAERLLGRKAYTALNTLKQQVGSNMTGFNVRSAMTNFASAIQGASKTNKLGFIQGTISTVKNIIHKDNLIDKSDFLTNRFGSDNISKKAWQKAVNAGQIFMTGTDYFTANQIWRGKYYENLNKGMSEKDAIKNADDFASRIMGDRTKGQTAEIFNSKTLGLLTQFQLEVNNQWSSLIHDNKMDIQSGNKSGAMVVFQLGQLFGLSYLFNSFMKSVTGSKVMIDPIDLLKKIFGADDDDKEKTLEQRAEEALGSLIDDIPFASVFTGGRIPIGEAFTGVETLAKKLTNQKDKYGGDYTWGNVKDDAIESAFYLLLPTGYGQAKKAVKGMSMYSKKHPVAGSYTDSGNLRFEADTSGWGKTKAFLFGQYASKSAQDYINRNYSPVDKDKLKEMKKIGLSADEYTKLKTEITQATKTQDDKKNYKYYDENGKLYYYNKDKDIVYDSKYKKTSIDIGELDKAKRKELLEKFLKSKKGLTSKQKEYLLENTFEGGKK